VSENHSEPSRARLSRLGKGGEEQASNSQRMQKIIRSKIDSESLQTVAQDLKGYVKVVVDIRREILAAGGEKHVDAEQLLLEDGSKQGDLWGAGLDLETNEIDFDSLINLRPTQNTSREILDKAIREKVELIARSLLQS